MTNFALTLRLYQKTGSALQTALLAICSYAPYVVLSIFAGALSDRWDKRKTMLTCDTLAACCSVAVFILLKTENLLPAPRNRIRVIYVTMLLSLGTENFVLAFSRTFNASPVRDILRRTYLL